MTKVQFGCAGAALLLFLPGCGATGAGDSVPAASVPQLSWGSPVLAGDGERNPGDPYLAASPEGRIFVSWSQDSPAAAGHNSRDLLVAALNPGTFELESARQVNDRPISSHGGENLAKFTVGLDGGLTAIMPLVGDDLHTGDLVTAHGAADSPFAPTVKLNDDDVVANHGFTGIATAPDGRIFAAWVDGRNDLDQSELFLAVSQDGGRTFSKNLRIADLACNCCRPNIVFLDQGKTVVVSYRFVEPDNVRNHVVIRSTDGGRTFTPPVAISEDGWVSHGCPHAGVSIAADRQDRIHAVWWTGGRVKEEAGIYYTFSQDGGQSFLPRHRLAPAEDTIVMHTHVTVDADGTVYAAWVNLKEARPNIFFSYRPAAAFEWSPASLVNQDPDWYAFYPLLAAGPASLHIAWLERKGERTRVQLRSSPLAGS